MDPLALALAHRAGSAAEHILLFGGQLVPEGEGTGETLAVLAAFRDRQDLRHLKSPLPQRFGSFGACQSALIDGLRHLQKPAGAGSGGVEAGDGGLHFFICHDAAVLHSGTDLPGQRRTARNAQRHKHTRQLHHIAALRRRLDQLEGQRARYLELYAGDLLSMEDLRRRLRLLAERGARLREDLDRLTRDPPRDLEAEITEQVRRVLSLEDITNGELRQLIDRITVSEKGDVSIYPARPAEEPPAATGAFVGNG